jgi:DNA-binding Lrp family transcriptional regulator
MNLYLLVDAIDSIILSQLGRNARVSSQEITVNLKNLGHELTDRAIRHRLQRLEKEGVIIGYSALLNPSFGSDKINRTLLIKFRYSKNLPALIERLTEYLNNSRFCLFSSRLTGDFDWICNMVFDTQEQYDLESNNFLSIFSELIADLRSYESKTMKVTPYTVLDEQDLEMRKRRVYDILKSVKKYDSLNSRLQAILENLVKYYEAAFARIWFVDKERKWLILKFSAGKYKNIDGEFSKVSIDSLKIGPIVKSGKPQVSNDVANDPRIRHPDWVKRENLKSFAGYPLTYKGTAIGVIAMFSEKRFSIADFEILEIFCRQLSQELSSFFEAKDFLTT